MSISDPNYNVLYFLITHHAPHMHPFLKLLPQIQDGSTPDANPSALTPPSRPKTPMSTYSGLIICYCCGEAGHGTRQCPTAKEMVQAGTIIRNDTGRITWKDGVMTRSTPGPDPILAPARPRTDPRRFIADALHVVSRWRSISS